MRKNGCGRMIATLKSTRHILDLTIERTSNSYLIEFYPFVYLFFDQYFLNTYYVMGTMLGSR